MNPAILQSAFVQTALPIMLAIVIATLVNNKRLDDLRDSLNRRIDETNRRIDETNRRFDEMNRRFDEVIRRLERVEAKFDDHEKRVIRLEEQTALIKR